MMSSPLRMLSAMIPSRICLSILAPRICLLCGAVVDAKVEYPLCDSCAEALCAHSKAMASKDRCSSCGKPLISSCGVCTRCRRVMYGFDSAFPLFLYSGDVRTLVLAYKSSGRRSLAVFFAMLIAPVLAEKYPGSTIVPVPPRSGKMQRKGWDQVEDIARILETRHGFTVRRLLVRSGAKQQKALGLEARAANMLGSIRIRRERAGGGVDVPQDLVLLDDVLTTGATLSACAEVLKTSGATRVDAMLIAAD